MLKEHTRQEKYKMKKGIDALTNKQKIILLLIITGINIFLVSVVYVWGA